MSEVKKNENSSWEILSEDVAVKQTDLSALKYNEIRVTNEVKSFFVLDNMEKHERREIYLHFNSVAYPCAIYLDSFNKGRGKLRWGKKFRKVFEELISGYFFGENIEGVMEYINPPLLRFKKIDMLNYDICFIFNKEIIENSIEVDERNLSEYEMYKKFEESFINKIETFKYHGTKCMACGFEYMKIYGELGKGREEIHLLNPLKKDDIPDVKKDFVTICSNCHKLLHSGYDFEELKSITKMNIEMNKTFKKNT